MKIADLNMALITGIDIPITGCQLILHQPTISEIAYIGEDRFFQGVQCLTLDASMFVNKVMSTIADKDDLNGINNFQIFIAMMQDQNFRMKRYLVLSVLSLFFPMYKITFTPNSIVFIDSQKEEHVISMVDENNFYEFQQVIKAVCCTNSGPMDKQSFNPGNEQAKKIAQKLMRARQRVAKEKNGEEVSVFNNYISILAVGLAMPVTTFSNYTMYMLFDQMERFILHVHWDTDVRIRIAGGKPEKEVENWMKTLHV